MKLIHKRQEIWSRVPSAMWVNMGQAAPSVQYLVQLGLSDILLTRVTVPHVLNQVNDDLQK